MGWISSVFLYQPQFLPPSSQLYFFSFSSFPSPFLCHRADLIFQLLKSASVPKPSSILDETHHLPVFYTVQRDKQNPRAVVQGMITPRFPVVGFLQESAQSSVFSVGSLTHWRAHGCKKHPARGFSRERTLSLLPFHAVPALRPSLGRELPSFAATLTICPFSSVSPIVSAASACPLASRYGHLCASVLEDLPHIFSL